MEDDNEKYICKLSTSKARELRQLVNHLAAFCSETSLLINSCQGGHLDVYTIDQDVSLNLISMSNLFFNKEWFIHPSLISKTTTVYHPCLNQYTCRAVQQLLQTDAAISSNNLNSSTATAEIRIPLVCLHLQNTLKSVVDKDIITLGILWSDFHHLHINIKHQATGLESNHLLHMLKVRRVFLHRQLQPFDNAYLIKACSIRGTITSLLNVGHDEFYLGHDAEKECLVFFAVRSNHLTVLRIPFQESYASVGIEERSTVAEIRNLTNSASPASAASVYKTPLGQFSGFFRPGVSDVQRTLDAQELPYHSKSDHGLAVDTSNNNNGSGLMFQRIAGPFKLAPVAMFCKDRMCQHYVIHYAVNALVIEGSANPLQSIQPIQGHPHNRIVMLLKSMPISPTKLSEFMSLVSRVLPRPQWNHAISEYQGTVTLSNMGNDNSSKWTNRLWNIYDENDTIDPSSMHMMNNTRPFQNMASGAAHGAHILEEYSDDEEDSGHFDSDATVSAGEDETTRSSKRSRTQYSAEHDDFMDDQHRPSAANNFSMDGICDRDYEDDGNEWE